MESGPGIFKVVEYSNIGFPSFAICEDKHGKFVFSADSPEIKPLEFPRCVLTTPRVKTNVPTYVS